MNKSIMDSIFTIFSDHCNDLDMEFATVNNAQEAASVEQLAGRLAHQLTVIPQKCSINAIKWDNVSVGIYVTNVPRSECRARSLGQPLPR